MFAWVLDYLYYFSASFTLSLKFSQAIPTKDVYLWMLPKEERSSERSSFKNLSSSNPSTLYTCSEKY